MSDPGMSDPSIEAQEAAADLVMERYTAAARSPAGSDAETEFWRALFAMPHWLFIPIGPIESAAPFAQVIDGRATIMGYLYPKQIREEALAGGFPEDRAALQLAMPPAAFVSVAPGYAAQGMLDLRFQSPLGEFIVPLVDIDAIAARAAG